MLWYNSQEQHVCPPPNLSHSHQNNLWVTPSSHNLTSCPSTPSLFLPHLPFLFLFFFILASCSIPLVWPFLSLFFLTFELYLHIFLFNKHSSSFTRHGRCLANLTEEMTLDKDKRRPKWSFIWVTWKKQKWNKVNRRDKFYLHFLEGLMKLPFIWPTIQRTLWNHLKYLLLHTNLTC